MIKEHEILIITKNTSGIVSRIMSMFNRRGYSVNKMTAGVTNKPGYARLTLTVDGDDKALNQIQKQVYKIVDVVKVKIFPSEGVIIVQIADIYRGKVLDVAPNSLVIELTGNVKKLRGFVEMMKSYGILEIAKTGVVAMSRGEKM